jgi:type I restriction enzyme S subunit
MSLSGYTSYRQSPVEWLGEVPRDWRESKLKFFTSSIPGGTPDTENQDYWSDGPHSVPWVAIGDMSRRDEVWSTRKSVSEAGRRSKGLRIGSPGTILFAMYASVGEVSVLRVPAAWNQALLGLQANHRFCTDRFLYYSLQTVKDRLPFLYRSNTQNNVNADQVMNLAFALPTVGEQEAIVVFLDRETAKIDALIAKQEQLIATLREDRTATITHAVTKGLDGDVEMKESGVEWMGEMPRHWRQVPLRRLVARIEQGVSPEAYAELAEDGWGVLKSGCVNGGIFRDTEHKKLPENFGIDPAIIVHQGDLLVSRASGSPDLVGSAAIVRDLRFQLILSDKTFRLVPGALVLVDYFEWVLNSRIYREQVRGAISGAEGLANNLPISSLRAFRFPIPPLPEQRLIAARLKEHVAEVAVLAAKAEQVIDVLREYRAALITDAVTGKIDVRGVA